MDVIRLSPHQPSSLLTLYYPSLPKKAPIRTRLARSPSSHTRSPRQTGRDTRGCSGYDSIYVTGNMHEMETVRHDSKSRYYTRR